APIGVLYRLLGAAAFVAVGGPSLAASALAHTFIEVPVNAEIDSFAFAPFALGVARIGIATLVLAVSFAAPVLVGILATDIALAAIGRSTPSVATAIAVPVRPALVSLAVVLSLSIVLSAFRESIHDAVARALDLVSSLAR